jgi:hypothetical protein
MRIGRARRFLAASLALTWASTSGCVGSIGGADGTSGGPSDPQQFECVPGDPSPTVLPRLSRDQYVASLAALADAALGSTEGSEVVAAIATPLDLVPSDAHPDHARLDQNVTQAHVDGQWHVAVAFAEAMTASTGRTAALVGSCATDGDASNDAACLEAFIRSFGKRAHRRPLTDAQVGFYRDEVFAPANGMEVAAIRDVITVMVLSPWFLYQVEDEGKPVEGRKDLFRLSPRELAARLSFHFWSAPPDDALIEAAESGALGTDEGYEAQVDRLLADPRTRKTVDRFVSGWLALDDLPPLETSLGSPTYDAFVGDDVPTTELRGRMLEDALDLVRWFTWEADGSLDDVFLSDLSFAKTPDLAAIYGGAPLWKEGAAPRRLPDGQRAGILTRPALLATGSASSHPAIRGREIRRRVLCDTLPPPPPNAMDNLPQLDPALSARERMQTLTEKKGSSCLACHQLMNPIGYNLERFDGLGRARAEETIFEADGSVLARLTIDTRSVPRIASLEDTRPSDDAAELAQRIVDSGKHHGCFSRHYFRFTFARAEDEKVDGCVLEHMRKDLGAGKSLRGILRRIAFDPTFRLRKLSP